MHHINCGLLHIDIYSVSTCWENGTVCFSYSDWIWHTCERRRVEDKIAIAVSSLVSEGFAVHLQEVEGAPRADAVRADAVIAGATYKSLCWKARCSLTWETRGDLVHHRGADLRHLLNGVL